MEERQWLPTRLSHLSRERNASRNTRYKFAWESPHKFQNTCLEEDLQLIGDPIESNDVDKTIETTDEAWEALVKTDPMFKNMRHRQWIYYNEWCEIFGNDRANGDEARNFESALQEVLNMDTELRDEHLGGHNRTNLPFDVEDEAISETPTPSSKNNTGATSRNKKMKKSEDNFESLASAINNLADITQNTMSHLVKELTTEEKILEVQDKVLCALQGIPSLTEEEQVACCCKVIVPKP